MLIKSALLASLSGSMNGMTAARNRYGAYLRNRTIPVNPRSAAQESARDRMTQLVTAWRDELDNDTRSAWTTYAANSPVVNRVGDRVFLTGLACYVRTNSMRLQAGSTRLDTAPTQYGEIALGAVTVAPTAGQATVDVTPTASAAWNVTSGFALVALSPPQPLSVNFYTGPFRFAGTIAGPSASSTAITNPFGTQPSGSKTFARIRAFEPGGRVTPPTIASGEAA